MSSVPSHMPGLRRREDANPPKKASTGIGQDQPSIRDALFGVDCPHKDMSQGRNLVVNLDGTSNQFSENSTNVVELFSRLIKDEFQLVYYNSGIGTYARPSFRSWNYIRQVINHTIDTAIAWNFEAIVHAAYEWLSENYMPGDRIFLFGFSRGAYQARVIAGMIHRVGLLHKGNKSQIPFAYELYSSVMDLATTRTRDGTTEALPTREASLCQKFKDSLCHKDVKVHFVGAWDTVSSIGLLRGKSLPETVSGMEHVCSFRHALALDERRVKFQPEYVNGGVGPHGKRGDVKEVWFAGSHSDIGGGSRPNRDLKNFGPALRWMTYQAMTRGLRIEPYEGLWKSPKLTESLKGFWTFLELLPLPCLSYKDENSITWLPHLSAGRMIQPGQLIHQSVFSFISTPPSPSNYSEEPLSATTEITIVPPTPLDQSHATGSGSDKSNDVPQTQERPMNTLHQNSPSSHQLGTSLPLHQNSPVNTPYPVQMAHHAIQYPPRAPAPLPIQAHHGLNPFHSFPQQTSTHFPIIPPWRPSSELMAEASQHPGSLPTPPAFQSLPVTQRRRKSVHWPPDAEIVAANDAQSPWPAQQPVPVPPTIPHQNFHSFYPSESTPPHLGFPPIFPPHAQTPPWLPNAQMSTFSPWIQTTPLSPFHPTPRLARPTSISFPIQQSLMTPPASLTPAPPENDASVFASPPWLVRDMDAVPPNPIQSGEVVPDSDQGTTLSVNNTDATCADENDASDLDNGTQEGGLKSPCDVDTQIVLFTKDRLVADDNDGVETLPSESHSSAKDEDAVVPNATATISGLNSVHPTLENLDDHLDDDLDDIGPIPGAFPAPLLPPTYYSPKAILHPSSYEGHWDQLFSDYNQSQRDQTQFLDIIEKDPFEDASHALKALETLCHSIKTSDEVLDKSFIERFSHQVTILHSFLDGGTRLTSLVEVQEARDILLSALSLSVRHAQVAGADLRGTLIRLLTHSRPISASRPHLLAGQIYQWASPIPKAYQDDVNQVIQMFACLGILKLHPWVESIAFCRGDPGLIVAAASPDRATHTVLWGGPGHSQKNLPELSGELSTISSDGSHLAVANGSAVNIYTVKFQPPSFLRHDIQSHQHGFTFHEIASLTFSQDNSTLATGHRDGWIKLWLPEGGRWKVQKRFKMDNCIWFLSFSNAGSRLAFVEDWLGVVKILNVKHGQVHEMQDSRGSITVAWSGSGDRIAYGDQNGNVNIWDTRREELIHSFKAHGSWVRSLAFRHDDKVIASGSSDERMRVWSCDTWEKMWDFDVGESVLSLAFSPDGNRVVSGGKLGTIQLWDIDTRVDTPPPPKLIRPTQWERKS